MLGAEIPIGRDSNCERGRLALRAGIPIADKRVRRREPVIQRPLEGPDLRMLFVAPAAQ